MKLLLDAGADVRSQDEDGRTARQRLPAREPSNAQSWDAAAALFEG
jgi:hypothetical protein